MQLPLIELDVLALVGISIAAAFGVGQIFRRLGIPQVVGFIVAGVLLGPSFFHLIPQELNASLTFVSELALGLIGFDMGGHLRFSELREMGRSILLIVLFESLTAFTLVSVGLYLLTGSLYTALIFGALAAATDPASTTDVINEYHAEGPLTTRLLATVGLDDVLALLLFSLAGALAESLLPGGQQATLLGILQLPFYEVGGSLLVGLVLGFGLDAVMRLLKLDMEGHDAMVIPIGVIFVCAGLARTVGLSITLTTMVLGLVVINRDPQNGKAIRATIERAGPVIYVLFFALAGARLSIGMLPAMGLLGVTYLAIRLAGKLGGAWLGGTLSQTAPVVRNNLGLALFAQAGVVIGLALDSYTRFSTLGSEGAALGSLVLSVITATTLIAQLIGPIFVKVALTRAGERPPAS